MRVQRDSHATSRWCWQVQDLDSGWSVHPGNQGIIIGRKEKVKKENLKRGTLEPVARRDWWKGLCAYRAPDTCMSTLVGFMVGVQVVFGVVVSPVFRAGIPVVTELVLRGAATEPPEAHIHHFGPAGHNCFVGRGSGGKNVIFSNGPNSTSECSKLLY